jgi:hypothetical protein
LLGAVDPYTGRYFSQAWIQRNVLRLTDDEIIVMDQEINDEKEQGFGLPVGVTNDVAQAQMMSQVPSQPMNPGDQEHQLALAQQAQTNSEPSATSEEMNSTLVKLKRIL